MKTSTLLACPFCGEPPELDTQRGFIAYNHKPGIAVAIYCTTCPADMTMCRDDFPQYETEQLVALLTERWNRRERTRKPPVITPSNSLAMYATGKAVALNRAVGMRKK